MQWFQQKKVLRITTINITTIKNNGEQEFGTTFTKQRHALSVHFRCSPTEKTTEDGQ